MGFLCVSLYLEVFSGFFFSSLSPGILLPLSCSHLLVFIFIIFYYYYFWIPVCFSNEREKERVWLWKDGELGEDLGGVEGRGTIIRLYCLKNIFNKMLGLSITVL